LAAVLIVAAFAKAFALNLGMPHESVLERPPVVLATVAVEAALGFLLFVGWLRRSTVLAGLVCFGIFSLRAAILAHSGSQSCGCFGVIPVNPRYTLAFDLSAWFGLLAIPLTQTISQTLSRWRLFLAPIALITCLIAATLMFTRQLSARAQMNGAIVLNPDSWVSKPLAILKDIDIGSTLGQGRWTVVLYDATCPHCAALLDQYVEQGRAVSAMPAQRVAFIQVPRPAGVAPTRSNLPASIMQGVLNPSRRWVVVTPVQLILENGVVVQRIANSEKS
jgi:hypothetical protein